MSTTPGTPNTDYQPLSFNQAIQFYWGAPNDGGSPILDYRLILAYSGGSLVYTPAAADVTFIATGLTNNVTYSATLEARNANGYSAIPGTYRDWQPGVGVPGPPVTATATLVGATNAILSWTPPAVSPTAPIYWYVIEAYSTSNPLPVASYSANGLTQSNYFITGLNSNLSYYFNVSAVNYPDYSAPVRTSTIQYLVPFSPTQVGTLVQWLDSADITTLFQNTAGTTPVTATGQNVAFWRDKSGQSNNVMSNAGIAVPTYGASLISTFNALNFSSNRMLRTSGTYVKSSNVTFITVGMIKNTIGTWGTWWGHFTAPDHDLNAITLRRVSNSNLMNWHTNNDNTVMNLTYTVDSPVIYSGTMANGTNMFFQQYNTASSASVSGTVTQSINTTAAPIWVGQSDFAGEFINGPIGEILYYQTVLTPFNRQKVEGYLAWKWGIQTILPTSHPFRVAAPYSNTVFAPTSFSSLQIWYDGADPLGTGSAPANGTSISTWFDKSGKVNNATAVNAASYVVDAGGNYLNFNGSNTYYNIGSGAFMSNQYYTIFIIERLQQNTGGLMTLLSGTGSTSGGTNALLIRYNGSTSNNIYQQSGVQLTATGLTAFTTASAQPTRLWAYSKKPSNWGIILNGTTLTSSTDNTLLTGWAGPSIGRDSEPAVSSRYYPGHLKEILIYTGDLSTDNRQTVEGYLAWKWALQGNLPITHPYKYVTPSSNYTTSMIVPQNLVLNLTATAYSGTGAWSNTAAFGPAFNATVNSGSGTLNAQSNGIVFNGSNIWAFPNIYNSDITLSAWYKRTTTTIAAGDSAILAQQFNGNTFTMCFGVGSVSSNVRWARYVSGTWDSSTQTVGTTIGQWVHIVMTYTNSIVTTYSNGVSLGFTTIGGGLGNGGQWLIGANWGAGNPMNGEVGQVLIYNRALSAAEVLQNYTATSNTFSI